MFLLNEPGAFALGEDDRALAIAEVKALLRITTADEDATARGWTALGAAPVSAITGVADASGTALPANAYAIDIDARGTGWVRASDTGPLTVDYVAGGAAGWSALIAPIRSGIVLLAAHLYDAGATATPPPAAVTALWRPFRDLALAARAC
jgi:hypothetical protein